MGAWSHGKKDRTVNRIGLGILSSIQLCAELRVFKRSADIKKVVAENLRKENDACGGCSSNL